MRPAFTAECFSRIARREFNLLFHSLDYLGRKLEDYVATLPVPTKVLRTPGRVGLIRARLIGAKDVKGQVITFLGTAADVAVLNCS